MNPRPDKKTTILLLIGAAILIVALFLLISPNFSPRGNIQIIRIPNDATVTIDGKTVKSRVNLTPGKEYEVVGEKDGWESYRETIYINDFTENIIVALQPTSEEALKWEEQNPGALRELESAGGAEAVNDAQYLQQLFPIVEFLTFRNAVYTITYGYRDQSDIHSFFVQIRAPAGIRNGAVRKIYEMGFDAADYVIEFTDHENPFRSRHE